MTLGYSESRFRRTHTNGNLTQLSEASGFWILIKTIFILSESSPRAFTANLKDVTAILISKVTIESQEKICFHIKDMKN